MDMKAASVVIANWNGKHLLEQFLPSVVEAIRDCDEIIVVDNGSTDGSVEFLRSRFPQVRLITLPRNYGFSIANNLGALMAKNEIIVLLNNDMKPEKDFLEPMLEHFDDPDVFAVGAKLLRFDGSPDFTNLARLVVSGGVIFGTSELDGNRLKLVKKPEEQFHAPGGGSAFDRKKFLALGGFDPLFSPAYFEDMDLSLRALQKGWRIIYEPRSVIWHLSAQTGRVKPRWFFELVSYRNFWLYNFLNAPNFLWAGWQISNLLRLLVAEALCGRFLTYHISTMLLLSKWWGIVKRRFVNPPMNAEQLVGLLKPSVEEKQEPNKQTYPLPDRPFVLLLSPAYEGDKHVLKEATTAARRRWNLPVAIIARPSQATNLKRDGIADIVIPFLLGSPHAPLRSFAQLASWLAKSNCQAFVIPSKAHSPSKGKFILLGFVTSLWGKKPIWEWTGTGWKRYPTLIAISRLPFLFTALFFYFLLTIALLSSMLISDLARMTLKPQRWDRSFS
ncbi:MAG: glycosyltransferase family 2 protein [Armatimonadetes bacterium]|nr:glycosyltransferase family 2 protein [Armatimonadota bacterium]